MGRILLVQQLAEDFSRLQAVVFVLPGRQARMLNPAWLGAMLGADGDGEAPHTAPLDHIWLSEAS